MTTTTNPELTTAYTKALQTAKDRLLALSHEIEIRDEARMSGKPYNYSHLGDIGHLNSELRRLAEFMGLEG